MRIFGWMLAGLGALGLLVGIVTNSPEIGAPSILGLTIGILIVNKDPPKGVAKKR